MPSISLFSGSHCMEKEITQELARKTGKPMVTDQDLVAEAARTAGLPEKRVAGAFSGKTSIFNAFTHEKERALAHLRLALAERLAGDNILAAGFCSHLVPARITHVLRVCLIADLPFRIKKAMEEEGTSEKEARRLIRSGDEERAAWVNTARGKTDPWDAALYDIVLPTHSKSPAEAAALVNSQLSNTVLMPTQKSLAAAKDFLLAGRVGTTLAAEGHDVEVDCAEGVATLTINRQVLMLKRLEEELKSIAVKVEGVREVATRVGKNFHQADIYRRHDFEVPSRILLVDDEKEFVQTLSQRLQLRDMGSAVAYDGESALAMVEDDEPDVMILDLKMPGIDGIEVLRKVRATRPDIEVIILTGHGTEKDRETCMELGAFAYLQKPVDIEMLSETLKRANDAALRKRKEH